MRKKVIPYLDKLEHRIRRRLARYPLIYLLIGGSAVILFWRGVLLTAGEVASGIPPELTWIDGPLSVVVSLILLLGTGLFISFLVSDQIILPGIRQETKIVK